MRAVMIGVGVFIILITLTVIVSYVNVAKDMATAVDKGINRWENIDYTNIMDYNGNVTIDITGINLINFIRKYVNYENIRLKLGQFSASFEDIVTWKNAIGNASEEKLMNINPNAKLKMSKNILADGTIIITVLGDIWIVKQAEPGINYGDLNASGGLDINDYNYLNEYLSNVLTEEQNVQADVNGDGIVNYTDYTILKEYAETLVGAEIKAGTGDINGDSTVNGLDADELKKYVLTDIQRESADINLDRIVDEKDLNKLREELIKLGIEVPLETE